MADEIDLAGDALSSILFGRLLLSFCLLAGSFAGAGPVVQLQADLFQGPQREVAQQESHDQSGAQRKLHERDSLGEPRLIDGAQKGGANTYMDGDKRRAVALQRHHHVKDPGRPEDLLH